MPEISRFLGIIIYMYFNNHEPPHFHAKYGEYDTVVEIKTRIINGRFPPHALRAVLDWADMHEKELLKNWELLKSECKPQRIQPLE